MSNILEKIVARRRKSIRKAEAAISLSQLKSTVADAPRPRGFCGSLKNAASPVALIAEVKKASPSQGLIRADFEPVEIARAYQNAGAAAISVLTEEEFFQGHLDYLKAVRNAVDLPVLRKDFIVSPYQVFEARAAGADAVLLIAECLDDDDLSRLHSLIIELGMTPLVEFYLPENLPRVLALEPLLVGVNNRDLTTFETSLQHAIGFRQRIPSKIPLVAESGIFTNGDVRLLQENQIDAMLVGQSLMEQSNIVSATRSLLGDDC